MKRLSMAVALFAAGLLVSCFNPASTSDGGPGLFSVSVSPKSLPAALDGVVQTADITGSGPSGAAFSAQNLARGTPLSLELAAGEWHIEARGKDSLGRIVIFGSANAMVKEKETTLIEIALDSVNLSLIAINSAGETYFSGDGDAWFGPFATGLSAGYDIAYAGGRFVAVGRIGTSFGLAVSEDGLSWASQNLGGTSAYITSVEANPAGVFVACGVDGATPYTFQSSDGLNWIPSTGFGMAGGAPAGPAWMDGYWWITNSSASIWRKSPDGIAWDGTGLGSASVYQTNALVGLNGRLIAAGSASSGAAKLSLTSSDGAVTFGAAVTLPVTGFIYALAASPSGIRVLSVGDGAVPQVNYSDDFGASWISASGTGTNAFRAAVYWREGYLIADAAGMVYKSADGSTFAPAGTAGSLQIQAVAAGELF